MSIEKITCYAVRCDNCNDFIRADFYDNPFTISFNKKDLIKAMEYQHLKIKEKFYCHNCEIDTSKKHI